MTVRVGDWVVKPAKLLYKLRDDRAGEGARRPLLSVSIYRGVVPRSDVTDKVPRAEDLTNYKLCEPGDVVVNRMSAYQGALGLSHVEGIVSPEYLVLRSVLGVDSRYLCYLVKSSWFVGEMTSRLRGIGSVEQGNVRTPRINPDDLGAIPVPTPPLVEQRAIADYLDVETERIDALIAKKRRMIELLEERLMAARTATVTGGDGERVRTASEWYPYLPFAWQVGTLARVTRLILDGPHVSPAYVDNTGVPFLSVRNISVHAWDLSTVKYISHEDYAQFCRRVKPERGDVLLTKGGNTGIARVVDFEFPFHVWVHVAILRPRRDLMSPGFLAAVLNSRPGYEQAQLWTRGATNQDLVLGRIAKIQVPIPPGEELPRLEAELGAVEARHRRLIDPLERQVELLTEHRKGLITAAVTGELDIPGGGA
jgi:type I restriction enzyme S subunit